MKTTSKKILCAMLTLVMVFASVPAFAAEIGDVAEWIFSGPDNEVYPEVYYYAGTIQEGENDIVYNVGNTHQQYYDFEVQNTGYYIFETPGIAPCFGQFDSEGKINDIDILKSYIVEYESCTEYSLIYLSKGSYIIGIDFWDTEETVFNVEFAGSEIVDLEYNQSDFDNLVINDDIYIDELENGFLFWFYSEHTDITFSGGKKLKDYSLSLCFTAESKPADGVHNGKISLLNYEESGTSSIYYIDNIIESIEIENLDDYLVAFEWYNGRYSFPEFNDEITVNYSDGTSETFVYGHNEASGEKDYITVLGKERYLAAYHNEYSFTFKVRIAQHTFIEKECKTVFKTNIAENAEYLKDNIKWKISDFNSVNSFILETLKEANSADSFFYCMTRFFRNLMTLQEIGEEVADFIEFVI